MSFKIWFWKLGLLPEKKCPICGNKTIGHSYDDWGDSPGYFTCSVKDCRFNRR